MKKVKTFYWKIQPIVGIGAYLDEYKNEVFGIDGWMYNIILPFVRIQYGVLYIPEIDIK